MKKPQKMYIIKKAISPYEVLKVTNNASVAQNFCKKLEKNFVPYTLRVETTTIDRTTEEILK